MTNLFPNILKSELYNPSYDTVKPIPAYQSKVLIPKDLRPTPTAHPTNNENKLILERPYKIAGPGEERHTSTENLKSTESGRDERDQREDDEEREESEIGDGVANKKISKVVKKKVPRTRVQPARRNVPSPTKDSRIRDISAILPEIYALLGFSDLNEVKLRELLERAEYDERKFFIKLRRNLYYYKTSLKKTDSQ